MFIIYICVDYICLLYLFDTSTLLCEGGGINGEIYQSDCPCKTKKDSEEYLSSGNIENDTSGLNNYCSRFKRKLFWSLWDVKVFKNTVSWILSRRNPSKAK